MKGLTTAGLNPLPLSPYQGISYSKLSTSLKNMSLPTLCELLPATTNSLNKQISDCGVKKRLHDKVEKAGSILKAINLEGNYN